MRTVRLACLLLVLTLLACSGKGGASLEDRFLRGKTIIYDKEMLLAYEAIEEAIRLGGRVETPGLIAQGERSFDAGADSAGDGERELSHEYFSVAEAYGKTAVSEIKAREYREQIASLGSELAEINAALEAKNEELARNISRLRKLRDTSLVSDELMSSSALSAIELAQEAVLEALDASAQYFALDLLSKAQSYLSRSERSLQLSEFGKARAEAMSSRRLALAAAQEATSALTVRDTLVEGLSSVYGLDAEPTSSGIKLTMKGPFAPLSHNIIFDFYTTLDALVDELVLHPGLGIGIVSIAAEHDTEGSNLLLSQLRADRVESYLIAKGLPRGMIVLSKGLGSGESSGRDAVSRLTELDIYMDRKAAAKYLLEMYGM